MLNFFINVLAYILSVFCVISGFILYLLLNFLYYTGLWNGRK